MKLTPHFTYAELTHTDCELPNDLPIQDNTYLLAANLQKMALILEEFRYYLSTHRYDGSKVHRRSIFDEKDTPIFVNSCYRTSEVNAHVGGKINSKHLYGLAFDIHTNEYDSSDLLALWYDFCDSSLGQPIWSLNLRPNYSYKIDAVSIHCDFVFNE